MDAPSKSESSKRLVIFLLVTLVVLILATRNSHPITPAAEKEKQTAVVQPEATTSQDTMATRASSGGEAAALKELRAEKTVKDVLYQPGQAVEWQIGVLDNGTKRFGFASYVCDVLKSHHATNDGTIVRIVDIVEVVNGVNFRNASLGSMRCQDYSRQMP